MLADKILGLSWSAPDHAVFNAKLANAIKYKSTKDAEDFFEETISNLPKGKCDFVSFARNPHQLTWIERERTNDGFLIENTGSGCEWRMRFAVAADDGRIYIMPMVIDFNPETVETNYRFQEGLASVKMKDLVLGRRQELVDAASKYLHAATFILIMINCKNLLTSREVVPSARLQKARMRRGKQPLFSHKILDISLTRSQANRAASQGMTRAQMRLHMVRGHFKVKKTGIYWWSPFIRGSKEAGLVTKDYAVVP